MLTWIQIQDSSLIFLLNPGSHHLSHMATLWIHAMSKVITRPIHCFLCSLLPMEGTFLCSDAWRVISGEEISTHLKLGLVLSILRKGWGLRAESCRRRRKPWEEGAPTWAHWHTHTGSFSCTSLFLSLHPAPILPHRSPFLNSHLSPQAWRSKSPWSPLLGFPRVAAISFLLWSSQAGEAEDPGLLHSWGSPSSDEECWDGSLGSEGRTCLHLHTPQPGWFPCSRDLWAQEGNLILCRPFFWAQELWVSSMVHTLWTPTQWALTESLYA